jgi:hypothetical protein
MEELSGRKSMVKAKVFLICLCVIIFVFSGIASHEMYAMERAIARSMYEDIFDDMQDIGYLEQELADYYRGKMEQLGWDVTEDVFAGSWPRTEAMRAKKEENQMVSLTLMVRPSRVAQWIHMFVEGDAVFSFSGIRPSEYFTPEW